MKQISTFDNLGLSKSALHMLEKIGFNEPSEIQARVIPVVLEGESDLIGIAGTGTGKTAAFGLPLLEKIKKHQKVPRAIILTPTRELAIQVQNELMKYKTERDIQICTVYGGQSIQKQISELRRGCDIVVGTPGRVLDMIERRALELSSIEYFVLDEADEMLKMGFIDDVELILSKSSDDRRIFLFSATMPSKIKELSKKYMRDQVIVEVKKKEADISSIEQVFYKSRFSEKNAYLKQIIGSAEFFYGIIFAQTRMEVEEISSFLRKEDIDVNFIHGGMNQPKREKVLGDFRRMKITILIATDVAARGIDVKDLTHVINYSLPKELDTYTHRIGRTGRAGKSGVAITLVGNADMRNLSDLERKLGHRIELKTLKIDMSSISQTQSSSRPSFSRKRDEGNRYSSNRSSSSSKGSSYGKKKFTSKRSFSTKDKRESSDDRERKPFSKDRKRPSGDSKGKNTNFVKKSRPSFRR